MYQYNANNQLLQEQRYDKEGIEEELPYTYSYPIPIPIPMRMTQTETSGIGRCRQGQTKQDGEMKESDSVCWERK